ncbi:phosphoribosyltransferase [Pseudomonas sp. BN414]|uniref:phosphoribosyltransferase n=1 Tax=Pseudomonas sp. BN414 TaxID=2567888 RepID=UPI00245397A4|nr:phosphoribosyltransferase family protein [Pseudomonas sp. BN414]MDH4566368.1 phosphoribosyltransferase [Pseudomonas sp. BN414]
MPRAPEFDDRLHAGRALAAALRDLPLDHPLILALPRGGVPVAHEIAKELQAPLDILLIGKIGAPGHEEFALGAVVDGANPQWVMDEEAMRLFDPPPGWFEQQLEEELREIERRRALYCGPRVPISPEGRDVVLVDDGLATGSSVRVALQALHAQHPRKVILAVPVGPADTVERLRAEVDELICLTIPPYFRAVGHHYRNFRQVTDQEVIDLLAPGWRP